ncbi:MAG: ammonia-forming cytochrome c nitrite reductase subunit c552 [Coriobacteriia bacterium]
MKNHALMWRVLLVVASVFAVTLLAGCGGEKAEDTADVAHARDLCGSNECHDDAVDAFAQGPHQSDGCLSCHEGADQAHSDDPAANEAIIVWAIDGCSKCHEAEAATYLYDDNTQAGPFGGSQIYPTQPKATAFPHYAQIMAGNAFTKNYNEEGAHAFLLEEHIKTTRGKYEACIQCKSTKVAYAWLKGTELTVEQSTEITLTHTKTPTAPAKVVSIPAGTKLTYTPDPETAAVDAKAVLPDGTTYTSRPQASEDATDNFNMMWAATIAVTEDTAPYGAGCNHCHDPHTGELRIVRQAMLTQIERKGVNPYSEEPITDPEKASRSERQSLSCAQCHVEYTCGKGVDGVDRDIFGWSKAADLVPLYTERFDMLQDWTQRDIGVPMHKSQHPETELYWNSVHYNAGASCSDCHMPQVKTANGRIFRSHWFTSPYKYHNAELYAKFASAAGLDARFNDKPCDRCHADRQSLGIGQQQAVFTAQQGVEKDLATAAAALAAVTAKKKSGATVDAMAFDSGIASYRQAQTLWENLIVSENSMGFHNYTEVMGAMADAKELAAKATADARKALGSQ